MSHFLLSITLYSLATLLISSLFLFFSRRPNGEKGSQTQLLILILGVFTLFLANLYPAFADVLFTAAVVLLFLTSIINRLFRVWTSAAQIFFASLISSTLFYIGYLSSLFPSVSALQSFFLALGILAIVTGAGFILLETFTVLNVMTRTRRRGLPKLTPPAREYTPFVSIHVPTYSEPPEVVMHTLDYLKNLAYQDYEVIVIDNNTTDENLWKPVEAYCQTLGPRFRFFHVDNLPGAKAGALNYILGKTDPRAEVIGVVDADYQVRPDFLSALVPYFKDPKVAIVQTPQDYRDFDRKSYLQNSFSEYRFFFSIMMNSCHEYNAASFTGTMGLIRKSVLTNIKSWSEWCVTEDVELGLRIHQSGLSTLYVDRSFGRGVMPYEFRDYKKQRNRWAFGNMQIIRRNLKAFLPFSGVKLSFHQKLSYIAQLTVWFNNLFLALGVLITTGLAVLFGVALPASIVSIGGVLMVSFLLSKSFTFLWAFRKKEKIYLSEAVRALFSHLSLNWIMATAWLACLFKGTESFWRTSKSPHELSSKDKLRTASWEMILFSLSLTLGTMLVLFGRIAEGSVVLAATSVIFIPALYAVVRYKYYANRTTRSHLEISPTQGLRGERAGS